VRTRRLLTTERCAAYVCPHFSRFHVQRGLYKISGIWSTEQVLSTQVSTSIWLSLRSHLAVQAGMLQALASSNVYLASSCVYKCTASCPPFSTGFCRITVLTALCDPALHVLRPVFVEGLVIDVADSTWLYATRPDAWDDMWLTTVAVHTAAWPYYGSAAGYI